MNTLIREFASTFTKLAAMVLIGFMLVVNVYAQTEQNNETANTQAEQNQEPDNTRTTIYFHPTIFIVGLEWGSVVLYSTIEKPMSLSTSLIIRPSLWNISDEDLFSDEDKVFRFGCDVGYRYYLNEKGDDWFIQGQIGLFYLSRTYREWGGYYPYYEDEKVKDNSLWVDIMGYVGRAHKFRKVSIYYNVGIGYANTPFNDNMNLMYDINLGIGIPIGK